MATATAETCANCGGSIGRLETPHVFQDNVVCTPCFSKLGGVGPLGYATPSPAHAAVPGTRVQTVEQTGKKWKAQQLMAVLCIIFGAVLVGLGGPGHVPALAAVGGLMLFGGLCWYILVRVLTWWNHG